MGDFLNFFRRLSGTNDWPALWQTGKWTAFEGWLYIISNALLWVSLLAISFIATRFAGKTGKGAMARLSPVIVWFTLATSIVLFMDAFMFWIPAYRLNALMRACAAMVSLVAVYKLLKYIPDLLALQPPADTELQATNTIKVLEAELRQINETKKEEEKSELQADELIDELQSRLREVNSELGAEIEELRYANEQLKMQNKLLEKKNADSAMQLEAANRELDTFSYAVSHDMRAPLRIINGYAEMLRTDHSSTMDDEAKRLLGIISTNTAQMGAMIDAVLSLARTGRKDLMILDADMASIIQSSINELAKSFGSNANFSLGEIHAVPCDSVLIRNVWSNLIANAIKYTAHLQQPEIHIGSERKDGRIMYYIKDNGRGFDMQYAQRLFGIFQKLHKNAGDTGLGIGLALVQRVVLKHGGYVWATGEENKGATFYFTLPEK